MDPELYKAAKEGDASCLSGIQGRNMTEEEARNNHHGKFLITRTQHGKNNILHIAARAGRDTFVAQALYRFPFLSEQVNSEGDTPLLVAARFGHLQVVKKLAEENGTNSRDVTTTVEEGTNSRDLSSSRRPRHQRDVEEGPLDDDQLEQATSLRNGTKSSSSRRQRGAESEQDGTDSRDMATAVVIPSHWCRRLTNLEQGTSISTTALHEALRNGHEEVARYLLRLKPKMATSDNLAGESPLFLAVESCCGLFMTDILLSKQPYSTKGPNGMNVLHAARNCCGALIIGKLIEKNRELMRELDNRGKAAIHHAVAVEADYGDLVDAMLETDPSIALFPDADGYTALLIASRRGCWKICKKILQVCPESIEACNDKGRHALHLAGNVYPKIGNFIPPEMWELVNVGDDEGNTPLHLAVKEENYPKAIVLTSSASIDLGAVNKEGHTALDLCQSAEHLNFKRLMRLLLRRQGASRGRYPNVPVGRPIWTIGSPDKDMQPFINAIGLVAALIATLTFAAAFTIPGGYNSDSSRLDSLGVAILAKKPALKVFILSDSLAMCCSILSLFLVLLAMNAEQDLSFSLTNTSGFLLRIALIATLVAFVSGVYAVIAPKVLWVAIIVCVIFSLGLVVFSPPILLTFSFLTWYMPSILIKGFQRFNERMRKRRKEQHYVQYLIQRGSPDTTYCTSNTNVIAD